MSQSEPSGGCSYQLRITCTCAWDRSKQMYRFPSRAAKARQAGGQAGPLAGQARPRPLDVAVDMYII